MRALNFALTPARQFKAILIIVIGLLIVTVKPSLVGDIDEYAAMTIALVEHGTPDIRITDLEKARTLLPQFSDVFNTNIIGMQANNKVPKAGFIQGINNKYYSIHFFAYSALAVIPFIILETFGFPPFKCYQIVNMAFVYTAGLALYRLFSSNTKAMAGIGLFMMCGGIYYWNWSSPECMSGAASLAGMILFVVGAPIPAGILIGLSAMQNPTIGLFLAFVPFLYTIIHFQNDASWHTNFLKSFKPDILIGIIIGSALFAAPILFNFYNFGVFSIIAKVATDSELISFARLHSFFFDLNQGLIIGFPGVIAALTLWGWRTQPARSATLNFALIAITVTITLIIAIPALSVHNWNSGARGLMRYAFWGAMPILFALLCVLSFMGKWSRSLITTIILFQSIAMVSAHRYSHVEFSPLASLVLKYAPYFYNPEPEIFAERLSHKEIGLDSANIYTYYVDGTPSKSLYHSTNANIDTQICGSNLLLSGKARFTEADRMWGYLTHPASCTPGISLTVENFKNLQGTILKKGWSFPEKNGDKWNGVWSNDKFSRLTIAIQPGFKPKTISILGHYLDGNQRTHVSINGKDFGLQALNKIQQLQLTNEDFTEITIDMEHEAPHSPNSQDNRNLAFFLQRITLR